MTASICKTCHRDLGKASLVRCSRNPCPQKTESRRATSGLMLWVGGVGVLIFGGIFFGDWLATTDNRPEKTQAVAPAEAQGVMGQFGSKAREWAGAIGLGGTPPVAEPAPASVSPPDPRAATRVATFSCSGALSASRSQICTQMDLAVTDYNLSLLYSAVLARTPNRASVQKMHAAWLRQLDALGDDREQIQQHYKEQRDRLNGA